MPEADREVKPEKLHFEKKKSIEGIPYIDEDGNKVDDIILSQDD